MAHETERQFGISMPSLVGKSTLYMTGMPFFAYSVISRGSGCFVDAWPVTPIPHMQAVLGLVTNFELDSIQSASQSYRSEDSLAKALEHPNRALALVSYFILAHKDKVTSLQAISDIKAWRDDSLIPVVIYEHAPQEVLQKLGNCEKVIQPSVNNFLEFRVKTPEDLDRFLTATGAEAFCFDVYHSRFLFESPDLLSAVLRRTKLIHLSLGRDDINDSYHRSIDNIAELKDVLFNRRETNIFNIIKIIFDQTPNDVPVVFEIPISGLEKVTRMTMNPARLIFLYRHLKNNASRA